MVHQCQRLAFGFEAGDDLFGVHAELDDLERDPATDRFLLIGHIDDAAAAFTDLLEEFVAADSVAGLFGNGHEPCASRPNESSGQGQERAGLFVVRQQILHRLTQCVVAGAGLGQESVALRACRTFQGGGENFQLTLNGAFHGVPFISIH